MYTLTGWESVAFPNKSAFSRLIALKSKSRSTVVCGVFGTGRCEVSESSSRSAILDTTVMATFSGTLSKIETSAMTVRKIKAYPKAAAKNGTLTGDNVGINQNKVATISSSTCREVDCQSRRHDAAAMPHPMTAKQPQRRLPNMN